VGSRAAGLLDALLQLLSPVPPITVELRRAGMVESRHTVHAAVADPSGAVVRSWGDEDWPTFPRSAVKPLQALPLVESGAADAFGLGERELALACASHRGEAGHVAAVEAWLERIGCAVDDLECGVETGRVARASANNCSGKHAGFLTIARHLDVDPAGYVRADHHVQRLVCEALAETTGTAPGGAPAGVDGCGIPAPRMPLRAVATGAAGLARPDAAGWSPDRTSAARRLTAAMVAEPWYVGGTGRLCTDLLDAAGGDVVVKFGAEGVQLAALPGLGLGVAVKVESGDVPASEVALGHVLAALDAIDGDVDERVFGPRRQRRNWSGTHVADLVATA